MIRVLIVDEQAEVRRGLRMRLAVEPDMAVVGEAGDVDGALALAQALEPDVIVVDIGMRRANGVDTIKRLRAAAPAAAEVVLTLRGDEDTRAQAQEAGAQAFIEKVGRADALLQVIRGLAQQSRDPVAGASTGKEEPRRTKETRRAVSAPLAARRLGVG
jgi:DNA-binding NarL/FixJ family response regulator